MGTSSCPSGEVAEEESSGARLGSAGGGGVDEAVAFVV